ncbi:MAG: flavin reductase family protein [Candidatus Heimdallarchaeota archaeon]|nr:MAG: flavin reductase family protein [Candidatus Heimdallarchaeota archaeon]
MAIKKELYNPTVSWFLSPVVLVSCTDGERENIITIAWTGVICSRPPLISVSIRPSRFSHDLILKSKEFVLNIPTPEHLTQSELCGTKSGREMEKWRECGFTPEEAKSVSASLIKECPINIECKVVKILKDIGTHTVFIGEVQAVHVDRKAAPNSVLDVNPLCYSPKSGVFGRSVII